MEGLIRYEAETFWQPGLLCASGASLQSRVRLRSTTGGLISGELNWMELGTSLFAAVSLAKPCPSLLCLTNMASVVGKFSSY